MFRNQPPSWLGALVACAIQGGVGHHGAEARPASTASAATESLRASARTDEASSAEAKPVFQDADSLAFRALVAQPTELVEPTIGSRSEHPASIHAKVLGFNDFHGQLSTTRVLEGRPLGGAAVLASYLRHHSKGFEGRVVIAHAGDFVGASPAESSLFQDETSIGFFNSLSNGQCDRAGRNAKCNLVGILGNHEFDEGTIELLRIVRGGNHKRGPFLGVNYRGEQFPVLCANVLDRRSSQTILPPHVVKNIGGVKVGFIGAVLKGAPWFLTKSGISTLSFEDEVSRINDSVSALKHRGVRAIVVLIHQGARQRFAVHLPRDASSVSGEVVDIVARLDGEVDVVISGHSHSVLSAFVPNRDGKPTLLTQAFHSSTAFADIDLTLDSSDGQVVGKRASIVSTFADAGPGLSPDPVVAALVRHAEQAAQLVTSVVVGHAARSVTAAANEHGESPLGNMVADAQRATLRTDLAFTTPAWVRADLEAGAVTWGDLFTIQPFANRLVKVELTGQKVLDLLNQQWSVESYSRVLHASGLRYRWDPKHPASDRVVDVTIDGKPLDRNRTYTAAMNEFLAEGGEGFSVLESASRSPSTVLDIDALVGFIARHQPVVPRYDGRIRRID